MNDIKKLLINAHNDAKLLEWDPDNMFNRNPKDLETGLTKLFTRMSELQYRMYVEKKPRFSLYYKVWIPLERMEQ